MAGQSARWTWHSSRAWSWATGIMFAVAAIKMSGVSEFLYFQF
jgi:hypothetical protein